MTAARSRAATGDPPLFDPTRILYQDDHLLALNKEAGTYVEDILRAVQAADPGRDYHLAHRLDRDTSGCLLLARRRDAYAPLEGAFSGRLPGVHVRKRYVALTVQAPLDAGTNAVPRGEEASCEAIDAIGATDAASPAFAAVPPGELRDLWPDGPGEAGASEEDGWLRLSPGHGR